jgi:hypothetical protein
MIPAVQIPDFAGTLARSQQLQQQGELSRLQMLAQQQSLADDKGFRGALTEFGPALSSPDESVRTSALTQLMQMGGVRGAQLAMPLLEAARERQATNAIVARLFPGMGAPGSDAAGGASDAPAARPAVPQVGTAALAPAAPRGEAPPAVAQGIAARASLDPNAPDYPERIMAINNGVVAATMPGQRMPQGGARPATAAPAAQPAGGAGQAGLPTPQQLFALMISGNRGAMELGARLAPLVARDNPNWVTATADGQVFMVNPQNPSQRVVIGRSDNANTQANSPFGTGTGGAALNFIEQLGPRVASGNASPAEVRRYMSAITEYQQERVGQDGTRIVPRLPSFAPGADMVAQMYPGLVPGAPAAPAAAPTAPTPAAPAQPPGVPIGRTGMSAEPPALQPNPLPGAAGGVARTPQPPPQTAMNGMMENVDGLRKAREALRLAEGRPQSFGLWQGGANMLPGVLERLDPQGVETRAMAADLGSIVIHQRSGAAVTAAEFPRLRPFIPQVGDPPDVVQTKIRRFVTEYEAVLRDQYEAYGPRAGFRGVPLVEDALRGGGGGRGGSTVLRFDAQGNPIR